MHSIFSMVDINIWYGKEMNAFYVATLFRWIIGFNGDEGVNYNVTFVSASDDHGKPYILLK